MAECEREKCDRVRVSETNREMQTERSKHKAKERGKLGEGRENEQQTSTLSKTAITNYEQSNNNQPIN